MFDLIPDDKRLLELAKADVAAARRCRLSNLDYFGRPIEVAGRASRKWLDRAAARRRMIGTTDAEKCRASGVAVLVVG
jgi:hypothetical protein